jgi:ribose-phosphate pyrophosphokinase
MEKVLWFGPAGEHLKDLANKLNIPVVSSSCRIFPDQEVCMRTDDDLAGKRVIIVQNTHPPQDKHLQQLYQMVEIAKHQKSKEIICIVPYLAYSRQDRRTDYGEPFSCEIVLRTLEMLGANSIITVELHNKNMEFKSSLEVKSIDTDLLFAEWLSSKNNQNAILVSPDYGSKERIKGIAKLANIPFIVFNKHKKHDGTTWYEKESEFDLTNKHAFIIDDLCSSGSTLIPLCHHLKQFGVDNISYGATHFFANGNTINKKIGFNINISGSDSIPTKWSDISVVNLIATYLKKI